MNTYTPDDVLVAADPGSLFRTQQTKALVMGASYANPEVSDHDIGTLSEAYNQVVTHYLEEGEWTHEETAEFMWDAFASVSAGTHKPQWTRISEEILGAR
ncbi:MAG: hypothetical protein SVW02_02250, partial [Candidatus Nanohaloarchaea archaeon]|nr:hypothetical protein [Candidatus Nanohaloarchaea archaeon]